MIPNTKTLVRLWAAILSDYEVCIGRFLNQPGWSFRHFSNIAKALRLPLIMNLTVGQGKFKEDHYEVISRLILDSARTFWLQRPVEAIDDEMLDKKRHLAGFYLVYYLYFKQPHQGQAKIHLDLDEIRTLKAFLEDVESTPCKELKDQLKFMFNQLKYSQAFLPGATSVQHGAENWRRTLLTIQRSEVVDQSFNERNVQDQLAYGTPWLKLVRCVLQYAERKRRFVGELENCATPNNSHFWLNATKVRNPVVELLLEGTSLSTNTKRAIMGIEKITQKPVLTLEQLTLDQIIQRRIMAEYRQRLQRCRKRIIDGPQKPKREYVTAGSIWGRKKEVEEGEEHRQRRERGGFSRNLWVYLNDLPFNYIQKAPPEEGAEGQAEAGDAAASATAADAE